MRKANSIQILVNYWEVPPSRMKGHVEGLLKRGVTAVASFVPWQAFEADISHSLLRFLQAATDKGVAVTLIPTPEIGIHYPYSGLPKDIYSSTENKASHSDGESVPLYLPPNAYQLPSLMAPEFTKRYYGFLSRFQVFLSDLERLNPRVFRNLDLLLSGSFWKYYRSPERDFAGAVAEPAVGDRSKWVTLPLHKSLDEYFSQREFQDPDPVSANRWKNRSFEDVNRRWFYQQCEDVFRFRTSQILKRTGTEVRASSVEIFTPEGDPTFLHSHFLQALGGGAADFKGLSELVDKCAALASASGDQLCAPFVHWTALGGFHTLSDAARQFLILKSLILMGGRGGGIFIDESEWFAMSASFRRRTELLARSLTEGRLKLRTKALYYTPHLWSGGGAIWGEIQKQVGAEARMITSLDALAADTEATLLVMDPTTIINRAVVEKLSRWLGPAGSGRVLILPETPLYTETAKRELFQLLAESETCEVDLGISYQLHTLGSQGARVVICRIEPTAAAGADASQAWTVFFKSMLALAEIEPVCRLSDHRLATIPLSRKAGEGRGTGLFVLNGSSRNVAADLIFSAPVLISDLAVILSAPLTQSGPPRSASAAGEPGDRFSLEVPPCGLLPLAVEGLVSREEERREAAAIARESGESERDVAVDAAMTELPGLEDVGSSPEQPWT
ncbi:MAG: hypothetical protein AB7P04_06605 [Bacteriovoracia bacterium]